MDIPLRNATAAVVGASGTIGKVCAELLAEDVSRLYLIGRRDEPLLELCAAVIRSGKRRVDRQHEDGGSR